MDYELIRNAMEELERLGTQASTGYSALAALLPNGHVLAPDVAPAAKLAVKAEAQPKAAKAPVKRRTVASRKPGYRRVAALKIGEPAAAEPVRRLTSERVFDAVGELHGGTAGDVAKRMGQSIPNVYYHLTKLVEAKRLTIGADKKYRRIAVPTEPSVN
jgi:hypothetical protein